MDMQIGETRQVRRRGVGKTHRQPEEEIQARALLRKVRRQDLLGQRDGDVFEEGDEGVEELGGCLVRDAGAGGGGGVVSAMAAVSERGCQEEEGWYDCREGEEGGERLKKRAAHFGGVGWLRAEKVRGSGSAPLFLVKDERKGRALLRRRGDEEEDNEMGWPSHEDFIP